MCSVNAVQHTENVSLERVPSVGDTHTHTHTHTSLPPSLLSLPLESKQGGIHTQCIGRLRTSGGGREKSGFRGQGKEEEI